MALSLSAWLGALVGKVVVLLVARTAISFWATAATTLLAWSGRLDGLLKPKRGGAGRAKRQARLARGRPRWPPRQEGAALCALSLAEKRVTTESKRTRVKQSSTLPGVPARRPGVASAKVRRRERARGSTSEGDKAAGWPAGWAVLVVTGRRLSGRLACFWLGVGCGPRALLACALPCLAWPGWLACPLPCLLAWPAGFSRAWPRRLALAPARLPLSPCRPAAARAAERPEGASKQKQAARQQAACGKQQAAGSRQQAAAGSSRQQQPAGRQASHLDLAGLGLGPPSLA
ncbi:uncharacterized protein PSFLO_01989 [Pseudozyma flocculosa]|uniref:Uncharacterized protein n=1 Tax=Pseudozyma flocculosa TaxID=84751 RepID=A0A5C3EWC7_9BASI|nr:uncharacterized protein PSFLO_01989 [Pseudozyma flocculosa]